MFRRILPQTYCFFTYFETVIALAKQACAELLALAQDGADMQARINRIKAIEHEADRVTHECVDSIHKTFITPMDRGDIHRLIKRLDDIIDHVDAAVLRIGLYEIKVIRPEVKETARLLVEATGEIEKALKLLRDTKNAEEINRICVRIYGYENEADTVLRLALARLFKEEKDAIEVIKWKEIYEILERSADRCEDVANVIQGVLIEAS